MTLNQPFIPNYTIPWSSHYHFNGFVKTHARSLLLDQLVFLQWDDFCDDTCVPTLGYFHDHSVLTSISLNFTWDRLLDLRIMTIYIWFIRITLSLLQQTSLLQDVWRVDNSQNMNLRAAKQILFNNVFSHSFKMIWCEFCSHLRFVFTFLSVGVCRETFVITYKTSLLILCDFASLENFELFLEDQSTREFETDSDDT